MGSMALSRATRLSTNTTSTGVTTPTQLFRLMTEASTAMAAMARVGATETIQLSTTAWKAAEVDRVAPDSPTRGWVPTTSAPATVLLRPRRRTTTTA
jgi:hypothetical protein